jgi:hypothetical protein
MEATNSLYFEHKGIKYSASVKEDITTEPKILFISPDETQEIGKDLKFELISGEWVGPESLRKNFPDTYESVLKAIKVAGYI